MTTSESQQNITEPEAIIAAKSGAVKSIKIIKNGDDFYVHLKLTWNNSYAFLSTMRNRKAPRSFRDIGRLLAYIETNYPSINKITLFMHGKESES